MFIGSKTVKNTKELEEKTPGGISIIEVEYSDGDKECFSKIMYDKIVSKEKCDATKLRDRRIYPVVESLLGILREWGVKINELPYISALLNTSLDANTNEALVELWKRWSPHLTSPDDADLITVDRVLKSKKKTLKDVIK